MYSKEDIDRKISHICSFYDEGFEEYVNKQKDLFEKYLRESYEYGSKKSYFCMLAKVENYIAKDKIFKLVKFMNEELKYFEDKYGLISDITQGYKQALISIEKFAKDNDCLYYSKRFNYAELEAIKDDCKKNFAESGE